MMSDRPSYSGKKSRLVFHMLLNRFERSSDEGMITSITERDFPILDVAAELAQFLPPPLIIKSLESDSG